MCGIIYKSSFNKITNYEEFIKSSELLRHRGKDGFGYYFSPKHSLGHNRMELSTNDYNQPIIDMDDMFMMDGYLTNYDELNKDFDKRIDSLLIFDLLKKNHLDALNMINGAYSIVYINNDKVYGIRDRFGIKPLYYTIFEQDIIIASEIKAIINYTKDTLVDKDGLCELLGMGPSHSVGKTVYKNIFEIPPGYYLEYDGKEVKLCEYYNINLTICDMTYSEAIRSVKKMVVDSIKSVIPNDKEISCLLSGGLDSSIICSVVSNYVNNVETYSIDYEGNEQEFSSNSYEITLDSDYARLVSRSINSNHNEIVISSQKVFEYLKKAVEAKDSPSMTDIDSSLLYLAENVALKNKVCLTGECADEIFAGYRWFYEDKTYSNGFPWIKSLDFKESLLNDNYKLNLKEYVINEYNNAIKCAKTNKKTKLGINHQQMCYLNLKYCMTNLLDRSDRMCMREGIDARAPFCDYRIIELLYILPLNYKYRLKTEKKILRDCFKKEVIKDVITRKKSPYPKSRTKEYEEKVKIELLNVLSKESILNELFNKEKLIDFINDDKEMEEPWYGQLMRKTSFLAYLYQIDYWYKKYNIRIDIVGK